MILHVVMFQPRAALGAADRLEILRAFITATRAAPTVRGVRLGRRVRHGLPGYEQAMRDDFEYLAIVEFDDVEGLTAYLRDPAHAEAGKHFGASAAAALAYDYALVSPADIAGSIG